MASVRETAADILVKVEEGAKSTAVLGDRLDVEDLSAQDKGFLTVLVMGTLEHLLTIDEKLKGVSSVSLKKMRPFIRNLLRLSAYQLMYLDNIPASAVCNEAVKAASRRKYAGLKGFVNGVLRSIARDPSIPAETLSLRYSMPEYVLDVYRGICREEDLETVFAAMERPAPLTVRYLTGRASAQEITGSLTSQGIRAVPSGIADGSYILEDAPAPAQIRAFTDGLIQIQDVSSALCVQAAGVQPGDNVLDLCAAPGGKTVGMADSAGPDGHVISCDLTAYKTGLIEENLSRCHITNTQTVVNDATVYRPEWEAAFDVVMADLPCSGLGTIGHKPEIRYRMNAETVGGLAALQRTILANAVRYVRPGGRLVYSTCTVTAQEDESNREYILEQPGYVPEDLTPRIPAIASYETAADGYVKLLPGMDRVNDGFFISVFRRDDND